MTIGGNSKAKAYFKAHGVSESMSIEEKYKTKAAENYKQALLEDISNGKQNTETTSSPSTPMSNSKNTSSKKSTLSMRDLEKDLPIINKNGSNEKKDDSSFRNRFFDDFDDDDWGDEKETEVKVNEGIENNKIEVKEEFNEEFNEEFDEEVKPPPKESKSRFKSSRFLYSDSLIDESDDFNNEDRDNHHKNVEDKKDKDEDYRNYRGVSMFDDPDPPKETKHDDLQRFFDEDDDYRWSRKSNYGKSRNKQVSSNAFSRFENAKSISSSDFYNDDNDDEDYYYNRRESDEFDAMDLLTKIADTAKSDFKAIGETIYEGGKRLAEWFSDFTSDY